MRAHVQSTRSICQKMVKCSICGKELNSEAGLLQHHKAKHSDVPLPQSSPSKDEGPEGDKRTPKKRGGMRRNLEQKKKRRRVIILGVALALLVGGGLGAYSIYNITSHPS